MFGFKKKKPEVAGQLSPGEVVVKPQFAKNGPVPRDTFEYDQLADGTRVPRYRDVQPSFEGVGDTLQIGAPTMSESYFVAPSQAQCGRNF